MDELNRPAQAACLSICAGCGGAADALKMELPSLRTYENKKGFFLMVDMPEYDEGGTDIQSHFHGTSSENFRVEFSLCGRDGVEFKKSIGFPKPIQTDGIQTRFDEGYLLIWLPKVEDLMMGMEMMGT